MSKRGERRPWRVVIEWRGGPAVVSTYPTEDRAQLAAQQIRDYAERTDQADDLKTCRVENRDEAGA